MDIKPDVVAFIAVYAIPQLVTPVIISANPEIVLIACLNLSHVLRFDLPREALPADHKVTIKCRHDLCAICARVELQNIII